MQKAKTFLLRSCAYTVILALALYVFLAISGVTDQGIPIFKFLIIFGYGLLISGAQLIYHYEEWAKPLRVILHYATLLLGFMVMYLTSGAVPVVTPAKVFIALIIFSFLYFLVMLISHAIKQAAGRSGGGVVPSNGKKKAPREEYKPRFGGDGK